MADIIELNQLEFIIGKRIKEKFPSMDNFSVLLEEIPDGFIVAPNSTDEKTAYLLNFLSQPTGSMLKIAEGTNEEGDFNGTDID